MKLSDYVFQYLENYGIKDLFMLCGGGCMHLVDSVGKSNINYISCLHEQAATIASIAYSQYRNEMGVVLVTTGPGGTNTITGVAGAWADGMPLLILSGQVKRSDISGDTGIRMLGFQEVDIVSIVKPITKYAVTIEKPEDIKYHLDKAVYYANEGKKGPVWLDIPLDVQAAEIDPKQLKGFVMNETKEYSDMDEAVNTTVELLKKSKRPVMLAGYGIMLSGAYNDFIKFVKSLNIPVLTTWKGIDFLDDKDPLYFGRPGTTGQRGANFMIQNCDLLLAVGARLDYGQIGYEHDTFAREAVKIIVDIDEAELKKYKFKVDIPIIGDAGKYLRALLEKNIGALDCEEWRVKGREWNNKYPVIQPEFYNVKKGVSTYAMVDVLSSLTDENYVYAPCCSGVSVEIMLQSMKVNKGVRVVLNSAGLGSMGFGVPTVLGVGIASGKKTVCVTGEGGFQLNIQELESIKRLKIPAKFFICNNGGYGSIMNTQMNYFKGHFVGANRESGLTLPELEKIAYAYGYEYHRINNTQELEFVIKEVLESPLPVICEVMITEGEKAMPKVSSAVGSNGKMYSKPLEDLWPFLKREEFEREMLIEIVSDK